MVDGQVNPGGDDRIDAELRELDWSATPIGQPDGWPEALRVSLEIVLNTTQPMLIWWGDELTQFYNDGFRRIAKPLLRTAGLGASGKRYWREISSVLGADVEHVMAGKGSVSRERQLVPMGNDDQSLHRYWTYTLSPINHGDGVGGALLVCRDETKEHLAALALKSREVELARVMHIANLGGLEVDLTSGFRNRRSPEYLAIHGLPPAAENETHENWLHRIHPEDRYRTERTFIDAISGGCKGYSIQYRIIRPSDEKVRWILAKTEIERDRAGRAMRLVGAHTDVTDRVDVQAIERARFTAALDLLRCAVILTDEYGGIVYLNRSAQNLINEGSLVRSRHNIIRAVRPSASHELGEALKLAARADVRVGNPGWTVTLSKDDASLAMAHVLPLAKNESHNQMEPFAVAAIFIRDREDARHNAELLAATFELTPAEVRLLSCLLAGRDLSEASSELRITPSTVKTQLRAIFRKTGVNRQSELILLASQLSVPVHGRRSFLDPRLCG
jgi:PAS domain-containing protein/DNA-binding CsgD family transcriptional regulator